MAACCRSVGVVDYSIGKGVAPGVFVVADMSHPRISERMEDLKMGKGPYFTFHRPYHLTSLEVPLTCARVVLYGKADMVPLAKPVAEVCAVAKKDLKPGDRLDAIGEYCYRAWIMTAGEARAPVPSPAACCRAAASRKPSGRVSSSPAPMPPPRRLEDRRTPRPPGQTGLRVRIRIYELLSRPDLISDGFLFRYRNELSILL